MGVTGYREKARPMIIEDRGGTKESAFGILNVYSSFELLNDDINIRIEFMSNPELIAREYEMGS